MGYEENPEPVYAPAPRMRCVTLLGSHGRVSRRFPPLILAAFAGALGCSLSNVDIKTLPDGSHELTCRSRLSTCLVEIQETCAEAGYDVVTAFEERKRYGPIEPAVEIVRSHATIRCRKMHALIGGESGEPATAAPKSSASAPPAPPAPPAPKPVCQPGATQICVGVGACQGGQQCLPDGSGFGACDCGPAPAPIPAENTPAASAPSPSAAPAPVPAPSSNAPKPSGP